MPRYGAWRKWSGILATATERDFERKALPFLRLFWQSLQQLPARGPWDVKGIDLLVWVDSKPFPCGVQCKGFQVQELGDDQIRQVIKSIEDFRKSDVVCDTYIVIHNRDGKNRKFNDTINKYLSQLVSYGKANKAELWDRQTLLDRAFDRIKHILNDALCKRSQELLGHFQDLFEFGRYYLPIVPVIEKKLIFKRGEPCSCEEVHPVDSHDISKALLSPSNARWTLLTGRFGTGKTTAVLRTVAVAASSRQVMIFVPCATLPSSFPVTSTNMLLEEITKSLKILDEFEDQDREVIYEVAGPTLAYLLRQSESPYILILDGLDENRAYTNLAGLQCLSNQLADLNCPIVLTTRIEHLNTMFGDFSLAFNEFSTKKGPKRNARLLELVPWGKKQVLQLVNQIIRETTGVEKERLSEFLKLLSNGEYAALYGELPSNPLFLQFILEDVAAEGIQYANRPLLLFRWVKRKIWRDRSVGGRLTPDDSIDVEDFVDRMVWLMENVANLMTYRIGNRYELAEFIDSVSVTEEAKKLFNITSDQLLGILLNSVLMPQGLRRGSNFNVTFAFRVFHEYFLASYLVRENLSDCDYPDTVRLFYSEIKSHIRAAPNTAFAAHFVRPNASHFAKPDTVRLCEK